MITKGFGLYCTVSKDELHIALSTLTHAAKSEFVKCIVIVVTDSSCQTFSSINDKTYVICRNYGKGYNVSIELGGYDQISARNSALDFLEISPDVEWVMQHDADDLYQLECYERIISEYENFDAIACSCFTFKDKQTVCAPASKCQMQSTGKFIYDPHIRIWKKKMGLRFEKSPDIEKHFSNTSRHCGVKLPDKTKVAITEQPWHFHLHALLGKRHSEKIALYPVIQENIPDEIASFIRTI